MKIYCLFIFLAVSSAVFSQIESLVSVEKMSISNDRYSEYNFIPTEKGAFFISNKPSSNVIQVKDKKDNYLSAIYYCSKKKKKYGNPKSVDIDFYNHIGSFTVNSDENFIIFTGRQNKTATTYGLFQTQKVKGNWTKPVLIFKNMEQFHLTDPFLTITGDTLIFATNLAGGMGGLDIYFAIGSMGNWDRLENVGKQINTSENERYPYLRDNILYFSSKRENGVGGLDIYANAYEDGAFSQSIPMSSLINSGFDDFSVTFEGEKMFFSSNRDGKDNIYEMVSNFPKFDCFPTEPKERCFEFSDEYSEDRDSITFNYEWSMGDGTIHKTIVADHCFEDTGTFIVELKIYDGFTKELIAEEEAFEVTIEDPDQLEIIYPDQMIKGNPLELKVEYNTQGDSSVYYWDFGDGDYGLGETVVHTYLQKGNYVISVGRIYFRDGEEFRMCTSETINIL